ncbi:uncharacterized protein LOC134255395 [Saccostrea cucullata]|uniref:uncharacterized protein LOC134255395 n=1 Tax=Saccostrea cuccullata TaxID=36930 RepID=UPI002ED23AA1
MARCGWVQPKVMKDLEPQKISALCTSLKKSSRAKYAKSRPLVATEKKKYNPLEIEESNTAILDSLSIALRGVVPEACLFKGLPRTGDVPTSAQEAEGAIGSNEEDTGHEDLSVIDKFDLSTISKSYGSQNTCYESLNFLPKIDDYEISTIEKFTVGQHENENWHRLRKGRITASKFYQVYTKVNSVLDGRRKDVQVDCSSLTKSIMCYTKINPNIKSLKYGRETEPLAICSYLNTYKKQHVNVSSRKCGLFIDKRNIFLSATPDLMVSCSCCGDGLLEVKCPLVPECKKCKSFCVCHLPEYVKISNDGFCVKKNHAYFTQIQGQLGITGRNWCDLYIYTKNGPLQCRIKFDQNFCKLNECQENIEPMDVDVGTSNSSRYFCPVCRNIIKETGSITSYSDRSIACDECNLWFHFKCYT